MAFAILLALLCLCALNVILIYVATKENQRRDED
jgi:hypothetical protein